MITFSQQNSIRNDIREKYTDNKDQQLAGELLDIGLEWAAYPRQASYSMGGLSKKEARRRQRELYSQVKTYLIDNYKGQVPTFILSPIASFIFWQIIKWVAWKILEKLIPVGFDLDAP